MNLHEYQAKEVLASFGIPIQRGIMATTPDEAVVAAQLLTQATGTQWHVVKGQVHAGGRGKAGAIKLAKNLDEVREKAAAIIGMTMYNRQTGPEGKLIRKVLITEDVYAPGPSEAKEFYMSILLDRAKSCNVIIYTAEGGMDIEELAENHPEKLFKEWIQPGDVLRPYQARKMAYNLGLTGVAATNMEQFLQKVYTAYAGADCSLLEINPLFKTSDDRILAVDCKMAIEESALYRHPELAAMRDLAEENPTEVEADKYDLNFIKLDGNVGCMVNGAGLAMATMDIIKLAGGAPANFLDVGGKASAETVEAGFRIILKDPNVKAILLNVFGGIVRCDRVANGVVEAYRKIGQINVPIIVRLQGTNADLAKQIIDESGLRVQSAILLREAAEKVKQVLEQ